MGAQAVIIANYEDRLTTMDRADDDETEACAPLLSHPRLGLHEPCYVPIVEMVYHLLCIPTVSCPSCTGIPFGLTARLAGPFSHRRYIRNLTIPAAFIMKKDGDMLKGLLADPHTGKYASFEDQALMVQMSWRDLLPRAETVRSPPSPAVSPPSKHNRPCMQPMQRFAFLVPRSGRLAGRAGSYLHCFITTLAPKPQ